MVAVANWAAIDWNLAARRQGAGIAAHKQKQQVVGFVACLASISALRGGGSHGRHLASLGAVQIIFDQLQLHSVQHTRC